MRKEALCWIMLALPGLAASDSLNELRRQVAEQERQIKKLEIENDRLRYMLLEAEVHSGDPLYGAEVSGKVGGKTKKKEKDQGIHVVAEGETLYRIASKHGVDAAALAELNQLTNPSLIRPGQRLRLPQAAPNTPKQVPPSTAMVLPPKPGSEASRQAPPALKSTPLPPKAVHHQVRNGENLYRISLRHGVDLDDLLAANPGVDPHRLRVGQKVRIPGAAPMLAGGG